MRKIEPRRRGTDEAGGLNKTPARSGRQEITVTVHMIIEQPRHREFPIFYILNPAINQC